MVDFPEYITDCPYKAQNPKSRPGHFSPKIFLYEATHCEGQMVFWEALATALNILEGKTKMSLRRPRKHLSLNQLLARF